MMCFLKKSIYDLKQSPRCWYKRFDNVVWIIRFKRRKHENCVYLRGTSSSSIVYLLLYVDEMLIASYNQSQIIKLKSQRSSKIEMKDLECVKKILVMEIIRERKR